MRFISLSALLASTVLVAVLAGCYEKIPEGPKQGDFLQAELAIGGDREVFPQPNRFLEYWYLTGDITYDEFLQMTDPLVRFRVQVTNVFDEVVEGTRNVRIKLHLEEASGRFERTLSFTQVALDDSIIMFPGDVFKPFTEDSLTWDQTDSTGKTIHVLDKYQEYLVNSRIGENPVTGADWIFCDTLGITQKDTVAQFGEPIEVSAWAEVRVFNEFPSINTDTLDFRIEYIFPPGLKRRRPCLPGPAGGG